MYSVNWNDGFWVKVGVFRGHSLSFEIYIQFLIRPVWQTYLKICALTLFKTKGWKRHWNPENICRWKLMLPTRYWCTGADAAKLMPIHSCFYSAVCYCELDHTFLYKEKHVRWLCCVLPIYENAQCANSTVDIFTFIHFQPLWSPLVCFRSP